MNTGSGNAADFILPALERFSAELWNNANRYDGFIMPARPYELRSALSSIEQRRLAWIDHELEFPWGLDEHVLISMSWDSKGPGMGSGWSVHVIRLPSGRRIYVENSDWCDEPQFLSVSDKKSTPRVDRRFLQRLFLDNGASFNTGIFGSPPDSVSTCIRSFPFLVDLFVAGFDAAGDDCWSALLENWSVWDEAYENPDNPIELPVELLHAAREEDIRLNGTPRSMSMGRSHERRVQEAVYKAMMKDEISDFISEHRFCERSPREPEAKIQIVARYLCQAVNDPGLG